MSIPVTILGGFLGAGKTTALNRLLRDGPGRVGVLVNDFGAIEVDAALIADAGGAVVSLANGCVCCTIGPDLGDSLARVTALAPDRIVVEASGVSDPWRIAQLARLEPGVVLDAVVVLVDAAAFPAQLADPWLTDTLERQVARADLVVISKADAADPTAAMQAVQRLRPGMRMAVLRDGILPDVVLPGSAPGSRLMADVPEHGFATWSWPEPPVLDEAALRRVLAGLPASVLRAKGFCRLGPGAVPHVLQLAGARWSLERWHGAAPAGFVLIGTPELPAAEALAAMFAGTVLAYVPINQET